MFFNFWFSLTFVFRAIGILLFFYAWFTWKDRTHRKPRLTACYWLLLGIIFVLPDKLSQTGYTLVGCLVIGLVILEALNGVQTGDYPESPHPAPPPGSPTRPGMAMFIPIGLIPAFAFAGAYLSRQTKLDQTIGTVLGLALGAAAASLFLLRLTRCQATDLIQSGRKITEEIGTVNILPQLLASLGAVFTTVGVGSVLASYAQRVIPSHSLIASLLIYFLAMTLFTALMGNSFAAFAVITGGIGIPLVIVPFGLNPALVGILGLTAGSCGTLLTPMAANFNLLPATLLEMNDQYSTIRFQWKLAVALWLAHPLVFAVWYWTR
ncbi:MAG: DUF979 domain-containing protein [Blastocatellia bacterium]|nr:DUF979 domain-containing protein [Blastocatellia bacterium]